MHSFFFFFFRFYALKQVVSNFGIARLAPLFCLAIISWHAFGCENLAFDIELSNSKAGYMKESLGDKQTNDCID